MFVSRVQYKLYGEGHIGLQPKIRGIWANSHIPWIFGCKQLAYREGCNGLQPKIRGIWVNPHIPQIFGCKQLAYREGRNGLQPKIRGIWVNPHIPRIFRCKPLRSIAHSLGGKSLSMQKSMQKITREKTPQVPMQHLLQQAPMQKTSHKQTVVTKHQNTTTL